MDTLICYRYPKATSFFGLAFFFTTLGFCVHESRRFAGFSSAPAVMTVPELLKSQEQGSWTSLRGGRWRCDLQFHKSRDAFNTYVPVTEENGRRFVLLHFNRPFLCEEASALTPSGAISEPDQKLLQSLPRLGLDLSVSTKVIEVSDGPRTALWHALFCAVLALAGAYLFIYFRRFWKRTALADRFSLNENLPPAGVNQDVVESGSSRHLRPLFPMGPFKVNPSFAFITLRNGLGCMLAGAALACGVGFWQYGQVRSILKDRDAWSHGKPAGKVAVAYSSETHHAVMTVVELALAYSDQDLKRHYFEGQNFWMLFGRLKDRESPEVRMDPARPDRFALNWAVLAIPWRWASIALFLVVMGGLGMGLCAGALQMFWRLWLIRLCANDAEEVHARLVSIKPEMAFDKPTGNIAYELQIPGETKTQKFSIRRSDGEPLYLDNRRRTILVLKRNKFPRAATPIHDDLRPYSFTPEEIESIRANLESTRGKIGSFS